MTLKPGIHDGIPAELYHADRLADEPTFSRSIAHTLLTRSPMHARHTHPRLNPKWIDQRSAQFDHGTAVHALLFEGVECVIVEADSWRTNAAKEQRDQASAAGKIALLAKDAQVVHEICAAIAPQLNALQCQPRPFTDGRAEQTLLWRDRGVLCRARVDWLRDDHTVIDDLKTTAANVHPREWARRRIWDNGLDLQAAMYLRGLKALTGVAAEWRFIVVENKPPYALSVVSLNGEAIKLANTKLDKALDTWKRCLATDEWTGYPQQVAYAELPPWEEARWLEAEALEGASA